MNRRSLGIAGIFGALALTCAMQANAAKGIRTDANPGQGWLECDPCVQQLPKGLSFNPFGADPNAAPPPFLIKDSDEARVSAGDLAAQQGWETDVPGLEKEWLNLNVEPAMGRSNPDTEFGSQTYAQAIFLDLGHAYTTDPDSNEIVYLPNGKTGENLPGTWEIAFHYDFDKFPDSFGLSTMDPKTIFASLTWNGDLYTATYGDLRDPNIQSTFVFYDGLLHEPTGWSKSGPVASVPEPGTLALLFIGLAGLLGMRFRRGGRPVAALTAA